MIERFQQFTVLITKLNRSIRRLKTEETEEFNLKSPHVSCLHYIYRFGELTLKQLCEVCEEDKASISRSVEFLKKNGFVEQSLSTNKKYKSPLILTEKGFVVANKLSHKIDEILEKATEGISEEDRAIMYKCLNIISERLDNICVCGEK